MYVWGINTKTLCEKANLQTEYAALKNFKGRVLDDIEHKLRDNAREIIQKPFKDKCANWAKRNNLDFPDVHRLLERIEKFVVKESLAEEL